MRQTSGGRAIFHSKNAGPRLTELLGEENVRCISMHIHINRPCTLRVQHLDNSVTWYSVADVHSWWSKIAPILGVEGLRLSDMTISMSYTEPIRFTLRGFPNLPADGGDIQLVEELVSHVLLVPPRIDANS